MTTDTATDDGPDWDPVPTETALSRDVLPGALDRIERAADDWVAEHRDQFDPYRWGEGEGERIYRRKAFDELALNLRAADHLGYDDVNPDLRAFVVEATNDERYAGLIRRDPRRFLQFGYAALYVQETAELHPADAIETVLDAGLVTAVDRRPFLELMTWHLCETLGYDDNGIDPDAVLAVSGILRGLSPIAAGVEDAYGLTHHVTFGRDFGTLQDSPLDDLDDDWLPTTTVDGLVLRMAATGYWDLLLERLMTGVLEDAISPSVAGFALSCVSEVVAERGHVPGSRIDGRHVAGFETLPGSDMLENLDTWDDRSFHWALNYHPNLVAGTTARLVRERWLDGPPADDRQTDDLPVVEYHRLGKVLSSLSNYDLVTGTRRLEALHDSPVLDRRPDVVDHAVSFLRRQETPVGTFGYWPDERELYEMLDRPDPFDDSLVAETTAACEAALEPF